MAWYHIPGNEQDTVIFTQVRLGRNVAHLPFTHRMDAAQARELVSQASEILEANGFRKVDGGDLSHTAAYALSEQQYASPSFLRESRPHALFLNEPCNLSVSVCDEDHFRIRCLMPAWGLADALDGVTKVDDVLDEAFDMAFDARLGYLSPDPFSVGTDLKADILFCLPCLADANRTEDLTRLLAARNLSFHPFCPDGAGDLFRLTACPATTPALTDWQMLIDSTTRAIIDREQSARISLSGEALDRLIEHARRAEGLLRHAARLSVDELIRSLSDLRLGAAMGWLSTPHIRMEDITAALIESMPAMLLQHGEPIPPTVSACDRARADHVRTRLFSEDDGEHVPLAHRERETVKERV